MNKSILLLGMALVPLSTSVVNAQSSEGVVTAYTLSVRSGPDKTNSLKFYLYKDQKVLITDTSNEWYKIKTDDNKEGWASSKYIKLSQDTTVTKVVSVSSLNMRTGPSTGYKIIRVLSRGTEVQVISIDNGWAKIKYDSQIGYVSNSYLKDKVVENVKVKYVTANELNVRSGPSTSYKVLTTYKYATKVEVVSTSNSWSKIKYGNGYAYVSSKYLTDKDISSNEGNTNNTIINNRKITYNQLDYTFSQMVDYQYSLSQKGYNRIAANLSSNYSNSTSYVKATRADLRKYLNPETFSTDSSGRLQFLRIDKYRSGITASELNSYLSKYCKSNSVFLGKGQAFIDAAKKYNLDVAYLVAASMVETGYGSSKLAQGVEVTTESGNKVKVYNFFGIAAFDGTAVSSASKYAYKMGWTTIEKTLDGSAKWIASNYIHNSTYNQNTIYKMKWTYGVSHQYATSINWPELIGKVLNRVASYYGSSTVLEYEIPKYK